MNDVVEKFNIAYDRHSRRGGRTAFIWTEVVEGFTLEVALFSAVFDRVCIGGLFSSDILGSMEFTIMV